MAPRYHALHLAEQLELSNAPGEGLHLVHAGRRGGQLALPHGWMSLWLPLSGQLRMQAQDCAWTVRAGEVQLWRDGRLRGGEPMACWWLCLCGPQAAWAPSLQAVAGPVAANLLPWQGAASRELRRLLVRLARHARRNAAGPGFAAGLAQPVAADPILVALVATVLEHQHDLHERLPRCSGRSLLRRQQVMMRLLRVQHLVRCRVDTRVDVTELARSASYSPCHLIRIYRDVFDETPSEYAARLRNDRAWQLVRETPMPVCEITEALGFESQSSFCRAFKQSFGLTATEVRRLERVACEAA